VQSVANPSPCYLANIRVIFENNSEPAAENSKNTCSTGISRTSREFDNREKQGAPDFYNTERHLVNWESAAVSWEVRGGSGCETSEVVLRRIY
jgi:hypothetical protein